MSKERYQNHAKVAKPYIGIVFFKSITYKYIPPFYTSSIVFHNSVLFSLQMLHCILLLQIT